MPLTEEQRAALTRVAADEGVDLNALMAAAEQELSGQAQQGGATGAPPAGPAVADKIFQYQIPFIRVRELRKYLQMAEPIVDDDLPCGQWLAKHGGALAPQQGGTAPTQGAADNQEEM